MLCIARPGRGPERHHALTLQRCCQRQSLGGGPRPRSTRCLCGSKTQSLVLAGRRGACTMMRSRPDASSILRRAAATPEYRSGSMGRSSHTCPGSRIDRQVISGPRTRSRPVQRREEAAGCVTPSSLRGDACWVHDVFIPSAVCYSSPDAHAMQQIPSPSRETRPGRTTVRIARLVDASSALSVYSSVF